MSSHRVNPHRGPVPNWLKAFYAFLLFLAFTVVVTPLLQRV